MKLAPSILAADFARPRAPTSSGSRDVADLLHVDVHGRPLRARTSRSARRSSKSLRKHTDLFLDCHLMVDNPGVLLDDFADAGADGCTVHVELGDPRPLFDEIARARRAASASCSNPETPFDAVVPYLDEIDLLLVMSVHPGFGGQAFIPEVLDKVRGGAQGDRRARARRSRSRSTAASRSTPRPLAAAAGVDILVSGSAVFRADDPAAAARAIRAAAAAAARRVSPRPRSTSHLVAKVLVVSDGVAEGTRDDSAGPKVVAAARRRGLRRSSSTG